jgi:hypothetical protein
VGNKVLENAKKSKNDEFYTFYEDIEKEVIRYKDQLEGQIIYCNCDNPKFSKFYQYFKDNFNNLKLKKLISTYYDDVSFKTEYDGVDEIKTQLIGNGDFRSDECINILRECDIIITNPPFSLFRDFVRLIIENNKKFLIIGSILAHNTKEVFRYLYYKKIWLGYNKVSNFLNPEGKISKVGTIWWTNLNVNRKINYHFTRKYNPKEHPKLDNYDAINVDNCKKTPGDYYGKMAVPVIILEVLNLDEYEIIDMIGSTATINIKNDDKSFMTELNGKKKFQRMIIQKRRKE